MDMTVPFYQHTQEKNNRKTTDQKWRFKNANPVMNEGNEESLLRTPQSTFLKKMFVIPKKKELPEQC
jgi:hypothetical protein